IVGSRWSRLAYDRWRSVLVRIVVPPSVILVTMSGAIVSRVRSMGPVMPMMLIIPIAVRVANRNISYIKGYSNGGIGFTNPYRSGNQHNRGHKHSVPHPKFSCHTVPEERNGSACRRFHDRATTFTSPRTMDPAG